jgi:hypothetical protein
VDCRRCLAILLIATLGAAGRADAADPPLLVILDETGETVEGLPVLRPRMDATHVRDLLGRGFSGRLLRLYRWEQRFLASQTGQQIEPAYLLLSSTQGGFPRVGFVLRHADGREERKPHAGYVDLHRGSTPSGRFGAMDQIFPHELMHVIVRQLAGEPPPGGSNQVHALGVRTDPITAFNEGFAEHAQIMAIDDPDAAPETRALALDQERRQSALEAFEAYRRALTARWAAAPKARMTFPLWFSGSEQVLRYHGVKGRLFHREPALPERLGAPGDPYRAYLLASTLPGAAGARLKSPALLLSTEAFVSGLFWRWVTSEPAGRHPGPALLASFGVEAGETTPIEHGYLKLFAALAAGRPHTTAEAIRAYRAAFPAEAAALDAVVRDALGSDLPEPVPEIWLANRSFVTGTTLFDQFRALPRQHTFDLNAASMVDLLGVPGMTKAAAASVLGGAPYRDLDQLREVPRLPPELIEVLREMEADMRRTRAEAVESMAGLNLRRMLMPYAWHAAGWLAFGAILAALAYRTVRRMGPFRLALNGLGAALVGFAAGWSIDSGSGLFALAAPLLLLGVPAAAWQLMRTRSWRPAVRALAAWLLAAAVPAALVRPWG